MASRAEHHWWTGRWHGKLWLLPSPGSSYSSLAGHTVARPGGRAGPSLQGHPGVWLATPQPTRGTVAGLQVSAHRIEFMVDYYMYLLLSYILTFFLRLNYIKVSVMWVVKLTEKPNLENCADKKYDLELKNISQRSRSQHWKDFAQGSCIFNINTLLSLENITQVKFLWPKDG